MYEDDSNKQKRRADGGLLIYLSLVNIPIEIDHATAVSRKPLYVKASLYLDLQKKHDLRL